jgi:catechol 2,3-dioxygenase-like lactoylglutathione lyase family enzyme
MVKAFFHTGFVVKDLEASIKFYTEVIGLKLRGRSERTGEFAEKMLGFKGAHIRGAFLDLGDGGYFLELIQYMNPASGPNTMVRNNIGAAHLSFLVDNVDAFYAQTSKKGLRALNPPAALVQDGRLQRKAYYSQDPDGNWLEIVELAR